MKFAEINKRYTEIVAEYLTKGYTINAGTMSGSQGEIAHIDLTDGNSIIRVLVCEETELDENYHRIDTCQIIVGRCTDTEVAINNDDRMGRTIWNNKLDIILCEKYYKLSRYSSTGTEYGTKEEAEIVEEKRSQRYEARHTNNHIDLTDKHLELGKQIAKRVWNKKKVSNADIKVYKNQNGYYVQYKYECYRLH